MPQPVSFDLARVRDPALRPVAEKVRAGERLTGPDAALLYRSHDLLGIGTMADAANRARHGDVVTFAANQHINPTNVCVLRATCAFCGYARLPKEAGAFRYTLDQVLAEAAHAADGLTREFHIVGGLDMKAGLAYYAEMFRALKANFPHVHIKALTAGRDRAPRAHREAELGRRCSRRCARRGSTRCPGGGAETFSPPVREPDRRQEARRRRLHRRAPRGAPARDPLNCTMLYGHVETSTTAWSTCRCCATCRTRRAASSPTSRSPTTRTTTGSASSSGARGPRRRWPTT
jgi:aminodeoxyfutalosine synthase